MMRWRLLVAEALGWLIIARLLVSRFRFGLWRHRLGAHDHAPLPATATASDHQLVRAVDRATARLPGGAKCLPRAMALHWMLRRRGRPSQLVIARLDRRHGGLLEDLHAWVAIGDETIIGHLDQPYHTLLRFC